MFRNNCQNRLAEIFFRQEYCPGIDYINAAGTKVTALQPASARAFPARSYLWAIPRSELDLNKNLKQNPGC